MREEKNQIKFSRKVIKKLSQIGKTNFLHVSMSVLFANTQNITKN